MKSSGELVREVERTLDAEGTSRAALQAVLERTLAHFECMVGTLHRLSTESGSLELVAQCGVPAAILERVQRIPIGKGMAGLAAERRAPVQVCNLQTDRSGAAKPGAKLTEMKGSIAAPILVDGDLWGTIGVAKPEEHTYADDEVRLLLEIGTLIGRAWAGQ